MNTTKFEELTKQTFNMREKILTNPTKRRTIGQADRLYNFKELSDILGISPAHVAINYCTKHFVDILHMVDGTHEMEGNLQYLRELIIDVQNYLDLAYALEHEKHSEEVPF